MHLLSRKCPICGKKIVKPFNHCKECLEKMANSIIDEDKELLDRLA